MQRHALEMLVAGQVQGVGYRDFTRVTALGLGVEGFVENLSDGRVHVIAKGTQETLDALIAALRKGPPASRVTRVDFVPYHGRESFTEFHIRRRDATS
ncbi:MAG: acylphosphatase [Nitrospirota bacterium]|nr:acylphosphatase [Nitrospirota bacterium]